MTITPTKTDALSALIDSISTELFSKDDWDEARGTDSLIGSTEYNDMLSQVLDAAFNRQPESFKGMQWINTEWGFPLWVRPGVEWEPEEDDDEDYY
jgi:hypothetical protein